ncbi:MAG: glycosyltransferase family 4 protein [Mucilaginibacter sp.]
MLYGVLTLLLIGTILVYFRIARRFNIVDVPNHRSSHTRATIRGAGVIFPLSVVFCSVLFGGINPLLIIALCAISMVSFADDIKPQQAGIRFAIHILAVTLAMYVLNVYVLWPVWIIVFAYIIALGLVNAFNFMDGINGITGVYSLVALLSMWYINHSINTFTGDASLLCPAIACIVFLYFNFRKKALCFAGDVGAVAIAFWLIVLSILIINKTHSYKYLFIFSVYSVDMVFTLIKRIILRQNPLQPHRLHIYQLLVSNGGYSHLKVALLYGLLQLFINIFLFTTDLSFGFYLFFIVLAGCAFYLFFERRYRVKQAISIK